MATREGAQPHRSLRRRSLADEVREELAARVVSSNTAHGEVVCTASELAESAGVSVKTVRRGISELADQGLIRIVQRKGVILTAEPEELTRALKPRSGPRTFHMFCASEYLPNYRVDNAQMVAGIERRLSSSRARLDIVTLPDTEHHEADFVIERLSQGSSGCFIGELHRHTQHVFDECEKMGLPVVFQDPLVGDACRLGANAVALRQSTEGRIPLITRKLAELGHRRIVLAGWTYLIGIVIGTYIEDAKRYGFDLGDKLVIPRSLIHLGEEAMFARHVADKVLGLADRPTAILVIENAFGGMAMTVIAELLSRGVAVGRDISVVATEVGILSVTGNDPRPAGTRPSYFAMGEASADAILALADGTLTGPEIIDLESEWIDGDSLGPAAEARRELVAGEKGA